MMIIEENRQAPIRPREREILLAHPLFFRAVFDPEPYGATVGYWGLLIGDGWLEIVNEAADAIEVMIDADLSVFDFRAHLNLLDRQQLQYSPFQVHEFEDQDKALAHYPAPAFLSCQQIKEKLGGLEIYVSRGTFTSDACMKRALHVIEKAKRKAAITCESCGGQGILIKEDWWRVRCRSCEKHHASNIVMAEP